jgi:hypothetical protein
MEDRLDTLFQEWHKLDGAILLASVDPAITPRAPEQVIAESTAHCRASGRLTWVVLDWLIRHIDRVDEHRLLREAHVCGDLSVLGVLCDAANERRPDPRFERLMRECGPNKTLEPFFYRISRSPLASRLVAENPLAVFRRWNYLSNELRYLSDQEELTA